MTGETTGESATRVKICGITRLEDALLAAQLGAWAVGFVFHPGSPRFTLPERVREITRALPNGVEAVGVFVDLARPELEEAVRVSGVRIAQLHGNESPAYLRELEDAGMRTIKALRPARPEDLGEIGRFAPSQGFLIDAAAGARGALGGTGRLADWGLAREAKSRARGAPLILSGGLRPENVAQAIDQVRPWAVDVASGVEESPGIKSAGKLREFFAAVCRAGPRGEES